MNSYACGLCSRSFSQGPARDRHQLRCRSRPRSRKRACAACSRAKSRCDYSLPACHRCSTLSVQCIYPVQAQVIQISDHRPHQPTELSVETSPNAERGVSHPTSLVTLADVVGSTDHNLYESSTGAVPWWDYQNKNAAHLPTASVQPTPQSQDHITDRTEVALVSTEPFPPTNQGIFRTHPPIETTSTAFVDLSRLLAVQWTTAGQGLDLIESQLKQYPKFLINGVTKLPFIHWRHSSPPQRSETLATAIAMASLCASPEPHSTSLLLKSISMEVQHIYKKALKYPPAESLAAFQATLLYSIMRTICASASSVAMIDEKAVRIFQHALAKNIHCIDPMAIVQCNEWGKWIIDESVRRTFVILEALDMLCRARNKLPPVFCAYFGDSILPCPENVWQASTAEQWTSQYGTWEVYCGEVLRMKHILQWIKGEISGKEQQLVTWFQTVGDLGVIIFICARTYIATAGSEDPT